MTSQPEPLPRTTGHGSRAGRVAAIAGVTCGLAWLGKYAVLAATDGAESVPVAIGWAVGMLSFLLASAAFVFALLRRMHLVIRLVAAVAAVPLAFAALDLLDAALKSLHEGGGWSREEWALVLTGAAYAMAGGWWLTTRRSVAVRSVQSRRIGTPA